MRAPTGVQQVGSLGTSRIVQVIDSRPPPSYSRRVRSFVRTVRDSACSAPDLLVMENFIHAVRDAGYLSLSTALAELVDNSLQAGARRIDVVISRPAGEVWPEVSVADDGSGMGEAELRGCLRFGGTARFNERRSFGRFGMGLPMASLSQARRVEVVSWQDGQHPRQVSLDIDDVPTGSVLSCKPATIPGIVDAESGCVVTWRKCDKIEYQRLGWAEKAVCRDLGRMYRRFIAEGVIITVNRTPVRVVDPLMMFDLIEGDRARPAFEALTYDLATPSGGTSTLTVQFSLLPVLSWHGLDSASKKKHGIVADGGVSILRAGREIARGWYLMGGKRKENYDDWWRCEISFEPELDEYFGITINKQGIRPTAELREAIEPEMESIARMLNARVRKLFEDVKFQEAAQVSCRIANAADPDLPVIDANAAGPLRYRIGSEPLPDDAMFRSCLTNRTLNVTMNTDHAAFTALYRPLEAMSEATATTLRTAVELLVLSFARSTIVLDHSDNRYDELVTDWSRTYGRMLRKS